MTLDLHQAQVSLAPEALLNFLGWARYRHDLQSPGATSLDWLKPSGFPSGVALPSPWTMPRTRKPRFLRQRQSAE